MTGLPSPSDCIFSNRLRALSCEATASSSAGALDAAMAEALEDPMEDEPGDAADDAATPEADHAWAGSLDVPLAATVVDALVAGSPDPLAGAGHDDDEALPSVVWGGHIGR